ncbi:MAG: helix-turn-helix domain-containing protein [Lachnospiraceae bacterium]|nr:helix-turn-helix domain-containing protein [Solobacterium sp.]MBR3310177.1 helix-turn-helix domain-containing protein [Lachnospiraceae bacterium]
MASGMTQGEQNLVFFQSLIPKSEKLYVWCYDKDGGYVASSCPKEKQSLLDQTFYIFGGLKIFLDYARSTDKTYPEIIGSPIGMQWALSYESERNRNLIFLIGPVFFVSPEEQQVRNALVPYIRNPQRSAWADELCDALDDLPVMSYAVFSRYILIIHNTLTGQKLDLQTMEEHRAIGAKADPRHPQSRDRYRVYASEKAMLDTVRRGDIDYMDALQNSMGLSSGVPVKGQEPLRQVKTSIVVFITLVSRAAMEGGLPPDIAYDLGDSYIQSVEDCHDSGELNALAHAMYHDFVYRVHYLHTDPGYSHAIQKCCDYINLSLDRKIRTADLASLAGYTEYYLTEKFKKETGQSVSSYIRCAKIERAKILLNTTSLSVHEIAYRLSFNTPNYFIQTFRDITGFTPAQYRKQRKME